MKFCDYPTKKQFPNGTTFVTDSVMVVPIAQPCMSCGCLTKYLDICSEQYFCSDDCLAVFDKLVTKQENGQEV